MGPKSEFFDKISQNVDLDKLLAEDLGVILKETKSLLNKYNIPGMKVLQQRIPDDNEGLPFQGDTDVVNQNKLFEEASDDYFEEIHPKGEKVIKVVRDNYEIIMGGSNVITPPEKKIIL